VLQCVAVCVAVWPPGKKKEKRFKRERQ